MSNTTPQLPHVVIIGAGFGGLQAAHRLSSSPVRITLIDRQNYQLFQPLLYQVATAGLSVDDIAYPVRAMVKDWKNVRFHMAEVRSIDCAAKTVLTEADTLSYDYLIVAAGGATNFFGLANVQKYGFGMKTLDEAVNIRNHLLKMFELASHEHNPDKRRALLTFLVVGGGPTGVESAGALSELMYHVLAREYPDLNFKEARIVLMEASDRLLASMPEALQEATRSTLVRKDVEVRLCTQVADYDGEKVYLKGGEVIPARTLIWAAGVEAAPLTSTLQLPLDRQKRIKVRSTLQPEGLEDVFIVGDAACFEQPNGRPLPMVAQVAIQQGQHAARQIHLLLRGQDVLPFLYNDMGNMATIGRNAAVVHMGSVQLQGFSAWLFWSFVHILRLIDFRNRFIVFAKWVWDYFVYDRTVRIITRQ